MQHNDAGWIQVVSPIESTEVPECNILTEPLDIRVNKHQGVVTGALGEKRPSGCRAYPKLALQEH
jgi:hypothetical protein